MTGVGAADLPEGSIVASRATAWFRVLPGIGSVWHGTNGLRVSDIEVDDALRLGEWDVVRVGYGEES